MRNPRIHIPSQLMLAGLALVAMLLLPSPLALASEACPNEAVRAESNVDPTTDQTYDSSLPDCRAYEMVSPVEKEGTPVFLTGQPSVPAIAPDGDTIIFNGFGNGTLDAAIAAERSPSGWVSRFTGTSLGEISQTFSSHSVALSQDLTSEAECGLTEEETSDSAVVCAAREPGGAWVQTPSYGEVASSTEPLIQAPSYEGASADLSHLVFQAPGGAGQHLLAGDESSSVTEGGASNGGLYEVVGAQTRLPALRLVNVNNNGTYIPLQASGGLGGGDRTTGATPEQYQAVSQDGNTIYFTGIPEGGIPTLYARIDGTTTVDISNPSPSECTTCRGAPAEAAFQGASADGTKVFFTTAQQLLDSDTDSTTDIYEYDFNRPAAHNLIQVSAGGQGDATLGAGAEVQGVARISSDGSHVYFIARGVLTTLPNGNGETAVGGEENLYGYDSQTGQTKFVARLAGTELDRPDEGQRRVQATPDGRYLVFDTTAKLTPDDTSGAENVYRYDFETGDLIRISVGEPSFPLSDDNNGGANATIEAPNFSQGAGAFADVNGGASARAISDDGSYITFTTAAPLQSDDVNDAPDVYEWHDGQVSMISDGQGVEGVGVNARSGIMSPSGSDIFFTTSAELVSQDGDRLTDVYDARIDGGFPARAGEAACLGECQGSPSTAPAFSAPGTIGFTGGGNLVAPPFKEALEPEPKPEPLTKGQKLSKALKACKKDVHHAQREQCERKARARYAPPKETKGKRKRKE